MHSELNVTDMLLTIGQDKTFVMSVARSSNPIVKQEQRAKPSCLNPSVVVIEDSSKPNIFENRSSSDILPLLKPATIKSTSYTITNEISKPRERSDFDNKAMAALAALDVSIAPGNQPPTLGFTLCRNVSILQTR